MQMYPRNSQFLIECYNDATDKKYGYLFIDLHPHTSNNFRVQTGIALDEERMIYQPKGI